MKKILGLFMFCVLCLEIQGLGFPETVLGVKLGQTRETIIKSLIENGYQIDYLKFDEKFNSSQIFTSNIDELSDKNFAVSVQVNGIPSKVIFQFIGPGLQAVLGAATLSLVTDDAKSGDPGAFYHALILHTRMMIDGITAKYGPPKTIKLNETNKNLVWFTDDGINISYQVSTSRTTEGEAETGMGIDFYTNDWADYVNKKRIESNQL